MLLLRKLVKCVFWMARFNISNSEKNKIRVENKMHTSIFSVVESNETLKISTASSKGSLTSLYELESCNKMKWNEMFHLIN